MARLKMIAAVASVAILAGATTLPGFARADVYAFALFTGKKSGDNVFGVLDLTTGAYTSVKLDDPLIGLGELGNTPNDLYGLSSTGQLYSLTSGGAETAIGSASGAAIDFGSTAGQLYDLTSGGDLYTISTGGVRGGTGLELTSGGNAVSMTGATLSTGGGTLYFADQASSTEEDLYTVNTSNGDLTFVESLSTSGKTTSNIELGGMASIDGDLWGVSNNGGSGSNGETIQITNCSSNCTANINPNSNNPPLGLAFDMITTTTPPVPEPAEWALMLAGLGALGGMMRLRRRREALA